ncbi:MAG: hypothetical protein Q9170_000413 [Blastenia crenularia]
MDNQDPADKGPHDPHTSSPITDVSTAPDWPKGWKAYAALVSGFFMMFNCWGMVNAYGAFMGLYDEHLLTKASDLQLSLIGATESFLLLLPSIFAGRLLDARRHYYLGFTGFLLLFLGYFLLSFTSRQGLKDQGNYGFVWLTSGLLAGLGMTCFFTYSSHNVIQWFPRKRYVAAGITSTGAGAGGIIYPLTFKFLVANYGFPVGVRILSSIVAGTTIIAFILGAPCVDVPRRSLGRVFHASTWIDKHAIGSKPYTTYVIAVALVYGGFYSVAFHVTEWAEVKGFGTEEDIPGGNGERPGDSGFRTFWFLAIMNGTSIIGRLASAIVATRQATRVAYLIPDERQSHAGQWTGMMWSAVSVFALVGPLIAAALKRKFGMDAVGYWTGATMLVTTGLLAWSMYLKRKEDQMLERGRVNETKPGEQTPSSVESGYTGAAV